MKRVLIRSAVFGLYLLCFTVANAQTSIDSIKIIMNDLKMSHSYYDNGGGFGNGNPTDINETILVSKTQLFKIQSEQRNGDTLRLEDRLWGFHITIGSDSLLNTIDSFEYHLNIPVYEQTYYHFVHPQILRDSNIIKIELYPAQLADNHFYYSSHTHTNYSGGGNRDEWYNYLQAVSTSKMSVYIYLHRPVSKVEDDTQKKAVESVYPNPASSIITLSPSIPDNIIVDIYTVGGIKVKNAVVTSSSIDVSDLQPGAYFLRVNGSTQRFSVQR